MAEARIGFAYLLRAFDIQPSDEGTSVYRQMMNHNLFNSLAILTESGKPYKPHEPILGITAQPAGPVKVKFNPIK